MEELENESKNFASTNNNNNNIDKINGGNKNNQLDTINEKNQSNKNIKGNVKQVGSVKFDLSIQKSTATTIYSHKNILNNLQSNKKQPQVSSMTSS